MSAITAVGGPSSVSGVQATPATGISRAPSPLDQRTAATKKISKAGDLMQKLQLLLQKDPTSFKGMMNKLADQLLAAASKSNGNDASVLSKLSAGFAQAANKGSLEPLQVAAQAPHQANYGTYSQVGHRAGAGLLKTFVNDAVSSIDKVLGNEPPPPIPAAPVQ